MLGAVAPDLPAICAVAVLRARGRSTEGLLDAAYHGPGLAPVHMAVHSLLAPTAAVLVGRAPRAFAAGWLGHLLVDYATHARDAWPPAWPLSRRRFPSPVSYWEPDRHARAFSAIEVAALVAAASRDRGLLRAAGLAAAALAAAPAMAPSGKSMWNAVGARPDVEGRSRDLGEIR